MGTVFFKHYQDRVPAMWAVAGPFLIGGMVLTTFSYATESWTDVAFTGALFASLAYASLVGVALAWLIWFGLVRAGEASRVAAYVFFVPLVGIIIGAVFLDERLTTSLLVGAALIVAGIYLVNRAPAGKKKATLR
jgi:drug/metabolite transporter (DMT)-like permease